MTQQFELEKVENGFSFPFPTCYSVVSTGLIRKGSSGVCRSETCGSSAPCDFGKVRKEFYRTEIINFSSKDKLKF